MISIKSGIFPQHSCCDMERGATHQWIMNIDGSLKDNMASGWDLLDFLMALISPIPWTSSGWGQAFLQKP